jgi:hypothetical protein
MSNQPLTRRRTHSPRDYESNFIPDSVCYDSQFYPFRCTLRGGSGTYVTF